jgi:hypothetical protein
MKNNYPTDLETEELESALFELEELRRDTLRRIHRLNQFGLALILTSVLALGYLLGYLVFHP